LPSSFTSKQLRASLVLPQGHFPGTNNNTLVLTGLRMSAQLDAAGNWTNSCDLRIYGMRQADMNAVTVLFGQGGQVVNINATAILILESNDGSGWLQVFEGQFIEGGPDYSSLPDVCLHVTAMTGQGQQWLTGNPISYRGTIDAAVIAQQLAAIMNYKLENNGFSFTLHGPYLAGTPMDQFRKLAEMAGFDYYFGPSGTISICKKNSPRVGRPTIPMNPQTGLVGFPTLTRFGIELTVLFTPAVQLASPVQVSGSQVPGCDGKWYPYQMTHDLESITPNGHWFSRLKCASVAA
jgi:Baseplate hub gp41